jgi:hypothetical protein
MNHYDSSVPDPQRGSIFVPRGLIKLIIPEGDANRNNATATRLEIQIYPFPSGLDSLQESIITDMNYACSSGGTK